MLKILGLINKINSKIYGLWCKSKKLKEQKAKGLLSSLRLKSPLSKVPILGYILYEYVLSILSQI